MDATISLFLVVTYLSYSHLSFHCTVQLFFFRLLYRPFLPHWLKQSLLCPWHTTFGLCSVELMGQPFIIGVSIYYLYSYCLDRVSSRDDTIV